MQSVETPGVAYEVVSKYIHSRGPFQEEEAGVSYSYNLDSLLRLMAPTASTLVNAVMSGRRTVEYGLLSVGLKIHRLGDPTPFGGLINGLGGAQKILGINLYRKDEASMCLVLPPVGNARCAVLLLQAIERATKSAIFRNRDVHIQVCSPGRLSQAHAGILTIATYLGSDLLRRFTLGEFATTFKSQWGQRLVLYDAGGDFDGVFDWWERQEDKLSIWSLLPFGEGRTDVISVKTALDIQNVNLVATLLCHQENSGYWGPLGASFEEDMHTLLHRHQLDGLLAAPWVHTQETVEDGNARFISALQELMGYAFEDVMRLNRLGRYATQAYDGPVGILWETKCLMQKYRRAIVEEVQLLEKGEIQ